MLGNQLDLDIVEKPRKVQQKCACLWKEMLPFFVFFKQDLLQ